MSLLQYIKDTRAEMRHVAWPTRAQTIVYTTLVIGLSLFVAVYLGLFDYIFTSGLGRVLQVLPQSPSSLEVPFSTSTEDIIIGTSTSSE
jgi:preprotein translocase subunit SecE